MRSGNRTRLLEALRRTGGADRAQLAGLTGLSRATVSSLVGEAIARGHVVELRPTGPATQGRRPGMLRLDPRAGIVVGADLGHSHARVVLADLEAAVVAERRVAASTDDAGVALDTVAALVEEVVRDAGVDRERLLGVGLGVPRPLRREDGTVRSGTTSGGWAGVRPGTELGERLGLPVRAENDANLGALGEHRHGAARDVRDVVFLKLSTGVGAGLVLDGALYTGARGIAGDVGHVTVVANGSICHCGSRGCLETVASLRALSRALAPQDGDALPFEELLERLDGSPFAERSLRDVGRHVGRALAPLCMALDVGLVVVGGDLGAVSRHLVGAVRAELRRTAVDREPPTVRRAALGDRAEAFGAIALALHQKRWLRDAGLIALHDAA